ncbi:MAG: hypothetical protein II332_06815 [Kiritimatiellae bacterium]|nr:hypothetical protein [Kiritimatiellia bacterium]
MSDLINYNAPYNRNPEYEKVMAQALTEQHSKIARLTIETIKFGMMLLSVEEYIHYQHDGFTSLKSWLSQWCPTINYKTAQRHKQLAEAIREKCGIKAIASVVYQALDQGETEIYQQVEDVVAGSSARQLLLDFKVAESTQPQGRPEGTTKPVPPAVTREQTTAMAEQELRGIIDAVYVFSSTERDLLVADPILKANAAETLRHLAERLAR